MSAGSKLRGTLLTVTAVGSLLYLGFRDQITGAYNSVTGADEPIVDINYVEQGANTQRIIVKNGKCVVVDAPSAMPTEPHHTTTAEEAVVIAVVPSDDSEAIRVYDVANGSTIEHASDVGMEPAYCIPQDVATAAGKLPLDDSNRIFIP